mmetsp:Transcript_68011/g.164457  ORF Transcript_68011/g.164457 Transcript_68011/m.164457 type:complete len:215 (+) Transcript_68011:565-1209(+)
MLVGASAGASCSEKYVEWKSDSVQYAFCTCCVMEKGLPLSLGCFVNLPLGGRVLGSAQPHELLCEAEWPEPVDCWVDPAPLMSGGIGVPLALAAAPPRRRPRRPFLLPNAAFVALAASASAFFLPAAKSSCSLRFRRASFSLMMSVSIQMSSWFRWSVTPLSPVPCVLLVCLSASCVAIRPSKLPLPPLVAFLPIHNRWRKRSLSAVEYPIPLS